MSWQEDMLPPMPGEHSATDPDEGPDEVPGRRDAHGELIEPEDGVQFFIEPRSEEE